MKWEGCKTYQVSVTYARYIIWAYNQIEASVCGKIGRHHDCLMIRSCLSDVKGSTCKTMPWQMWVGTGKLYYAWEGKRKDEKRLKYMILLCPTLNISRHILIFFHLALAILPQFCN